MTTHLAPTSNITHTHTPTHITITQTLHPLHGPWTPQHPNPEPEPPTHTITITHEQARELAADIILTLGI